jgi:AraC-like DNA-binding protein
VAIVVDTNSLPPRRRLAVWQDVICDVYVGLDCQSDMSDAFWGSIARSTVGSVSCTRLASCAQRVFRTPSRISRASEDFVLVALGTKGACGVFQDGREAKISSGEFAIYDTTRPYELRVDDECSQTIFQVPRKLLQKRVGSYDLLTAKTFSTRRPLERLAYHYLFNISRTIDQVDPDTAIRLLDQGLDLVGMALSERMSGGSPAQSLHRSALLYRLKSYIHVNLRNPDLSLSSAAAALGVSTRYVSDLMAAEQICFRTYVQAQRLQNCKRELQDSAHAARNVGDIAFAWGFNNLAHFSRTFKEKFGVSPRACRDQRE